MSSMNIQRVVRTPFDAVTNRSAMPLIFSHEMRGVYDLGSKASRVDFPVLIHGESGVGKEVLARYIHENSQRSSTGSFVPLNCAAVQDTLAENELFGHTRDAYTGADSAKAGLLEVANSGTLFLDEITEMSAGVQSKLLRAVETKEFLPVGSAGVKRSDFRLICATNADLKKLMDDGRLRADLYFRLSAITIDIPPLRERIEEIPRLAEWFLEEMGRSDLDISAAAMELLLCYGWPGNVRELQNVMEFSVTMLSQDRRTIEPKDLPEDRFGNCALGGNGKISLRDREMCFRRVVIKQAMDLNGGDYTKVMSELQVTKDMIYRTVGKSANSGDKRDL